MSRSLEEAKRVLNIEAQAVLDLVESLDSGFEKAVDLIVNCRGKVIVTGMGKSGHVGRKIAATFSSTGSPSLFLHPAESAHGDLGVIAEGDLVIGISYGGEAEEMAPLLRYLMKKGIPLISLTGKSASSLAKAATVNLDVAVKEEACPLKLAPTASSTATLALGDALAMATLKEKGFQEEDFAEYHPGGKLGRRLLTRVMDAMHSGDALPLVNEENTVSEVVALMTQREVKGVVGVVDEKGDLVGVVTDGDIRRRLEKMKNPFSEKVGDIMTRNPKTVDCNEMAAKAQFVMEQFRIQILFAVDKQSDSPQQPVGILHIHDLLKVR